MKVSPICSEFVHMTDERYEPETDIFCATCGHGIYRGERVAWNENDEICHAECTEECAKL